MSGCSRFTPSALWAGMVLTVASFQVLGLPSSPAARQPQASAAQPQPINALQGKLTVAGSGGVRLSTSSGDIRLASENPQLLRTLQDSRLNGREVRLEGRRTSNGEFNASHILVVRDGKLYRLRYYCHVCNIPATEPGPCVCCQRPTELEEIAVDQVTNDMVLVP